jgi:hypothetical protein
MNLYKVVLELEIVVLAESEEEADELAKANSKGDELDKLEPISTVILKKVESLPQGWEGAIPYSKDTENIEEKTCEQLVREYKPSLQTLIAEFLENEGVSYTLQLLAHCEEFKGASSSDILIELDALVRGNFVVSWSVDEVIRYQWNG